MTRHRLGTAYLNQTPLAWEQNSAHIRAALDEARQRGVAVLCLPELAVSGYGCEDAFLAPWLRKKALESALALVPHTKGVFTAFGLPLEIEGLLYNALLVVADAQILGVVPKQILARTGLHYEPRWFRAWPAGKTARLKLGGRDVRCGDLLFRLGELTVGFEICEDAWAPEPLRPAPRLAARGANVILCPAASHFAFGKTKLRRGLGEAVAKRHGLAYLYSNLMGDESGRVIFDGGAYILDGQGRLAAEGARFSHRPQGLCDAVLDLRARPADGDAGLVDVGFRPPDLDAPATQSLASGQAYEDDWRDEFARAVALGLYDYLRKSGGRGYAISLSGGADSASCAVLVRLMAEWASAERGWPAFAASLSAVPGLAEAGSVDKAMPLLLRTLYQATPQSGAITRAAAEGVAKAVGSAHGSVDIGPLVDGYLALAKDQLGRPLSWDKDDLALQNLQARVRSPGIWLLANAEGRLLLATNNRSEAAAGYTTMDGDTSGGLAPIAGIGKHQLREWLRWMETTGPQGRGPIPALKAVNEQAPTAELRPADKKQTDEGDLMPYRVLDALQHAAVEERLPPLEAWRKVSAALPDVDAAQLKAWTARCYKLWSQSQWKRERLALSFHVDDHNVDPRSWCRWPVLSSGFEAELKELEQA